jgi:hypothetical protein
VQTRAGRIINFYLVAIMSRLQAAPAGFCLRLIMKKPPAGGLAVLTG